MAQSSDLGERIYRGTRFEVYRGRNGSREVARKVPTDGSPSYPLFEARAVVGGVSTVWSLWVRTNGPVSSGHDLLIPAQDTPAADADLLSGDLLASEAHTLDRHGRAWGPELYSFEPDAERPVLETAWCDAVPLRSLPREQARALLPTLLPALWDMLVDRPHGDLSPSNILVSPSRPRAFLIDPAPFVLRGQVYSMAAITSELHLQVVTTGASYPLLPPWHASTLALAEGATLERQVRDFVQSLTLSHHAPPVPVGSSTVMHEVGPVARSLVRSFSLEPGQPNRRGDIPIHGTVHPSLQRAGEPHPADLIALGIALYGILTGRHPFGFLPDTPPGWVGLDSTDDEVQGTERLMAMLERPIPAPSTLAGDVTTEEDRLTLALLMLDLPDRRHLASLCGPGR